MPDIPFIYAVQAVREDSWKLFLYWVCASGLATVLTAVLKAIFRRRGFSPDCHLLIQIDRRRTLKIFSLVLFGVALLWNSRHLWYEPWLYFALAADVAVVVFYYTRRLKTVTTTEISVLSISSAIVLAASPVALSPTALLLSCLCIYDSAMWKRLLLCQIGIPSLVFISAELIRNPGKWNGASELLLLSCLIICIVLAVKYKREAKEYRERLKMKENESDLDRQRIDELELGIIRNERENFLNMLDIQRREVRENAEKVTDQSRFMQDIYDTLCTAQRSGESQREQLLQEMKSKIQLRMNFTDERTDINQKVEDLHKDFSVRLRTRYPDLSPQERKLTALLRLDFPTKYIAAMLNISPKSVEIERHRLRKKFGLTRKTKLTEFVKNF